MGDRWYLDELLVNIQGRQQFLWPAVDDVIRPGQPPPPDAEAPGAVPRSEVRVEHDPVDAVVRPVEQILIATTQRIGHLSSEQACRGGFQRPADLAGRHPAAP
jgi:hypothetical protein